MNLITQIYKILRLSILDIPHNRLLKSILDILSTDPNSSVKRGGCLYIFQNNRLKLSVHNGLGNEVTCECPEIEVGQCLCGKAAQICRVQILEHRERNHLHLYVPIIFKSRLYGLINLYLPNGYRYSAKEEQFLKLASVWIGELLNRKLDEEKLKEAHIETRLILDSVGSIIIGLNRENRVRIWNRGAEKILGISQSEIIGRKIDECDILWDLEKIRAGISECRIKRTPIRLDELDFKRPDGSRGFLGITINPIFDYNKMNVIIYGADITERKNLELQLAHTQKLESIGQLAAGIAHELNTPTQYIGDNIRFLNDSFRDLTSLIDYIMKFLNRGETETDPLPIDEIKKRMEQLDMSFLLKEIPKAIEQSLEGIDRISQIIQSIKEFSHPGSKERASVDINRCIQNAITISKNEWKYVAELTTDLKPDLPHIYGYPQELNHVFLNIIINAAHAIKERLKRNKEEIKGRIHIKTDTSEGFVEIRISDNGIGIPRSIQKRIFDPFFTTKEVGKGSGQGLAITHRIVVKKHNGSIFFETEEGKGTTFIIRLPINNLSSGEGGYEKGQDIICG